MKGKQNARNTLIHVLKHWIGLDRAIVFSVLARFWGAGAGVITVLLIARFLTPSEQGYYYTFSSIVALQVVFELGFSFVILQLAAHERARLTLNNDGSVVGDKIAHRRLASVLQKSVRWYAVADILMTAAILPAGFYFFMVNRSDLYGVHWRLPWTLLVLASMCTFQIDPVFSFLEGCGYIADVARRRLLQSILGSLLAWSALALHHGLFAPAMIIWGQVLVGVSFLLFSKFRSLLSGLWRISTQEHAISWRREIFPFQWRIAISWLCGFFIFQIFNPILFVFQGPVIAGQIGMSLMITSSIGGVALSWINTKSSPFGAMVSRGEIAELDRVFFRTVWQSSILLLLGGISFWTVLLLGGHFYPKMASRVVAPPLFALLLLGAVINHIVNCQAIYLRAYKREPFLVQAVISAVLISSLTFILAKYVSGNAVIVGLFAQGLLFGLPSGTYIFMHCRRKWNSTPLKEQEAV
jgi:hypothetical protein